MEKEPSPNTQELHKVIKIDVFTASPDVFSTEEGADGTYLVEMPLLNFELENGENFLMTSIPASIAVDIARRLNGVEGTDDRLTIGELVPEVCIVEKITIDSIVPYSNAYQATVEIRLEGFSEIHHFQMIPSHATLLALIANVDIYIADSLIRSPE
ncbi:MAG: hypothetical protein GOP50_04400 [Candidatus Heimdallarchaeota archaeon]|nr:hypothetical protein [Candidatus Heimdallarchaeota archaeon]